MVFNAAHDPVGSDGSEVVYEVGVVGDVVGSCLEEQHDVVDAVFGFEFVVEWFASFFEVDVVV